MRFFSGLTANFYYLLTLAIMNSVKPKDDDLTIFISKNWSRYEIFDMNYRKCSNNFAVDCNFKCVILYRYISYMAIDSLYFWTVSVWLIRKRSKVLVIESIENRLVFKFWYLRMSYTKWNIWCNERDIWWGCPHFIAWWMTSIIRWSVATSPLLTMILLGKQK